MKKKLGNCYEVAGNMIIDSSKSEDMALAHGEAEGTHGEIKGKRFGHAWIEIADGKRVIDKSNENDVTMAAKTYYKIGKITKVARYTREQVRENILKYKHWGWWEVNTRSVLKLRVILLKNIKSKSLVGINGKEIYKTKKGLFKFKKKEYKLEHMVRILAGDRYLIADPFEGQRRKVR